MPTETNTWADALGAFGALPRVRADIDGTGEREWFFAFDVPKMLAEHEEMCLEWGRRQLREELKQYPDRDKPNSLDAAMAVQAHRGFTERFRAGSFRRPHTVIDTETKGVKTVGGEDYTAWMHTEDGSLSMILAAMRIRHPEATITTVKLLFATAPDEMAALLNQLGKVMGEWQRRMSRSSQGTAVRPATAPKPTPEG